MEILQQTFQELGAYLPKVIAAVVVLILGWLLAFILSSIVSRTLGKVKLDDKMSSGMGGEYHASRLISQSVFWLVIFLFVIAFFSVLRLSAVSESLKTMVDGILSFLPRVLAAAVLLVIALAIGTTLKYAISKTLQSIGFDERFIRQTEIGREGQISPSKALANIIYWLILLLFLPAILNALALEGVLKPVQEMIGKMVAFLPNIFVASLILLVGWFAARLVRRVVTTVLESLGAEQFGQRIGLKKELTAFSVSNVVGLVVYVLILVPVVIAALDAVKLEAITQPASSMLGKIMDAVPSIFAAALILAIAVAIGRVISRLVSGILAGLNFDRLPAALGLGVERVEGKWQPSEIVGYIVMLAIILLAAISALNLLNFNILATTVTDFLVFSGHVVVGLVIFAIGLYFANLASRIIRSREIVQASMLAIVAKTAILVLAGAMGLRQMGLANDIIAIAFGLLFGAVAVAAAIAFGIGGREIASRKLEDWMKTYEIKRTERK